MLEGPDSKGDWYSIAMVADVDEPVSIGNFIRIRPGVTEAVEIRSVELLGVNGLTVVGITANGTKRQFGMIGSHAGYPLPQLDQDRLSLPGAVITADDAAARVQGIALTFGLKRTEQGRGVAKGFRVTFTIDGKQRQQTFGAGFAVCAVPGFIRQPNAPQVPCEAVPEP